MRIRRVTFFRAGTNDVSVSVVNEGNSPNPAGLVARIEIRFADGGEESVVTDGSWTTAGVGARDLGPWTMGPWNLSPGSLPGRELYPSYRSTAAILKVRLKQVPDLQAGEALRYCHRRVGKTDVYFVGNRGLGVFNGIATFRTVGSPEWWDPMTGQTRPLPRFLRRGATTEVPIRLEGNQSGFVVFRPKARKPVPSGVNFAALRPVGVVTGPWEVSFDTRLGGPALATFAELVDWTKRPEEGIRHYSGKAIYRATFGGRSVTVLSLGDVHNIASVRLNGKELGVAWCAPFQVRIPAGLLRPMGNSLEITVANLWPNRLIGDAGLSPGLRVTKTTWSPYTATSPLVASGLIGPVRLLKEEGK